MKKIKKYAFANAFGTALYVVIVATFIYFIGEGGFEAKKSVLIPIAMLMLLVFSVALVGTLIFGRPVMWYLDGKKREALSLLVHTLGTFLVVMLLVFILVMVLSGG